MDLERFQEFMLQSAARHEAEIAKIRASIRSLTNTVERFVDKQVFLTHKVIEESDQRQRGQDFLQESMDLLTRKMIEESD